MLTDADQQRGRRFARQLETFVDDLCTQLYDAQASAEAYKATAHTQEEEIERLRRDNESKTRQIDDLLRDNRLMHGSMQRQGAIWRETRAQMNRPAPQAAPAAEQPLPDTHPSRLHAVEATRAANATR